MKVKITIATDSGIVLCEETIFDAGEQGTFQFPYPIFEESNEGTWCLKGYGYVPMISFIPQEKGEK